MFKICGTIHGASGWTNAECVRHYRERHGPLIASLRTFSRDIALYRQNYLLPELSWQDAPDGPAGISGLWFGSLDGIYRAFEADDYLDQGRRDENLFCDRSKGLSVIGQEHVLHERSGVASSKMWANAPHSHLFIYRSMKRGPARDDFHRQWTERYTTPLLDAAGGGRLVQRYAQLRPVVVDGSFRRPGPYDLVEDLFFDSPEEARAFVRRMDGIEALRRVEAELSLPESRRMFLGASHVVFGIESEGK